MRWMAALLVLFLAGCSARRPPPAASAPPPVTTAFAAAALVPENAPLVLLARELRGLARAARELTHALDAAPLDRRLRLDVGISLLSVRDLQRAGLDPTGSAALYSAGRDVTLVLPVKDPARLKTFAHAPSDGTSHWVWREAGQRRLSMALVQGFVLVNLTGLTTAGERSDGQRAGAWLTDTLELLRQGNSLARSRRMSGWLARLGQRQDLVGALRPLPFNRASSLLMERMGHRRGPRCDAMDRDLAQAPLLLLGLRLGPGEATGIALLDLAEGPRKTLSRVAATPATLPAAIWDRAPARLALALPYAGLARWSRRLPAAPHAGHGCGAVIEALSMLQARQRIDRLHLLGAVDGRLAAALTALELKGEALHPTGAAIAPPLRGPGARLLAFLLAGPWVKREQIAGKSVHRVSAPAFLSGALRIRLDRWLRATIGEQLMPSLLEHRPAARPGAVIDLRLQPDQLQLDAVARTSVARRFDARHLLLTLHRFRRVQLRVSPDPRGLRVELSWRR